MNAIRARRYGYIQFHWEGLTLKGFIKPLVKILPSVEKDMEFQLIAHPDCDMLAILAKYNEKGRLNSLWK